MDAAKNDHVRFCGRGLLRKTEGIADIIGNILNFRDLIIVGENDGTQLILQGKDFPRQRIKLSLRHWLADGQPVDDWLGCWQNVSHNAGYAECQKASILCVAHGTGKAPMSSAWFLISYCT